jgi:two-component system phosphate regulon response regulator PhoB
MLPRMSGIDFAKRLKSNTLTKKIPIIMLTAKNEEENMILGLNSGADDYLTKPFSPRELVARIKAVLRRKAPDLIEEPIEINGLHLDPTNHRVRSNNNSIRIGPTEFKLLHFFMKNPERLFSRNHILDKVWGNKVEIDDRTVDVHIKRLRSSLSTEGKQKLIQTVRGMGYRFSENQEN